jgi:predicted CDP-diglyceride synthetase/phosphatidate cytidylyltransferase
VAVSLAVVQRPSLGLALIALGMFLAIYFVLHARRSGVAGQTPRVQWGWLIAIICCAAGVYLLAELRLA